MKTIIVTDAGAFSEDDASVSDPDARVETLIRVVTPDGVANLAVSRKAIEILAKEFTGWLKANPQR